AVEVAPSMETMAEWLSAGKVDLYFDSPYPAMIVSDLSDSKPILRRWKKGVEAYHTIIFTRTDSGVKTVDELEGKTIAFEEEFSTSGYMLPLSYLVEAGLKLVETRSPTAGIAPDEVGYVFSEDDQNSIQWVLSKRVTASAVSAPDFLEIPEEVRQQLTIVAETESLPRHIAIVSPTLTPEEVSAIKEVLLAMEKTEKGREILATFEKTAKFDEFPEGIDRAIDRMRELYELTQKQ
ncbi:MAG: phosphate/phosphite/phosphonate ABC transporter substrate-binding protein, partial [Spirulina sp.]